MLKKVKLLPVVVLRCTKIDACNGFARRSVASAATLGPQAAGFRVAKQAYAETGESMYVMMQTDLRKVAANHLHKNMRGVRLTNRK